MSRDKFEAWANSTEEGKKASFYWSHKEYEDSAYAAWLAGRESMRDEASNRLQEKHNELGLFHYLVAKEEIKKIEP